MCSPTGLPNDMPSSEAPRFLTARWITSDGETTRSILPCFCCRAAHGTELDSAPVSASSASSGFQFLATRVLGIPVRSTEISRRSPPLLRKRKVGAEIRRGVVFVKEIVPRRALAWVANAVYKESTSRFPCPRRSPVRLPRHAELQLAHHASGRGFASRSRERVSPRGDLGGASSHAIKNNKHKNKKTEALLGLHRPALTDRRSMYKASIREWEGVAMRRPRARLKRRGALRLGIRAWLAADRSRLRGRRFRDVVRPNAFVISPTWRTASIAALLALALGCFVLERVMPGWPLPRVRTWTAPRGARHLAQLAAC